MTTASITTVPFSKLVAGGDINARSTGGKDGLDALAASIKAKGLIQPLIVRPADGGAGAKGGDRFEVIAGNRRLAAIARLVKEKVLARTWPVPVMVRNEDDAEALDTSLAENDCRLPMHAVDRFEAFARLEASGIAAAEIAARYGIAERQVRQCLALGKLAPEVREAWRKNRLDAKAAQAFTLHANPVVQATALADLQKQWGRSAVPEYAVRQKLAAQRVPAHHVGDEVMARYLAAGGTVSEDLFSDESYLDDAALVATCTKAWAEEAAAGIKAGLLSQGWSWVARENELVDDGYQTWPMPSLDDELGEDAPDSERRCDEVEPNEAEATAARFSAGDKARSGVIIHLMNDGSHTLSFGIVKPSAQADSEHAIDKLADGDEATEVCPDCAGIDSDDCDTCRGDGVVPVEDEDLPSVGAVVGESDDDAPAIPAALLTTITAAQTEAVDAVLVRNPMLALRVFVASRFSNYGGPLNVRLEGMRSLREQGGRFDNPEFADTMPKFAAVHDEDILRLAANLIASAIDLRAHNAGASRKSELALVSALSGDAYLTKIRETWLPEDYFRRVPKQISLDAIEEMREAGSGAGLAPVDVLADMKRTELASAAAATATACGWLPPELRHPRYSLAPAPATAQRSEEAA